jgi:hypothetical protein
MRSKRYNTHAVIGHIRFTLRASIISPIRQAVRLSTSQESCVEEREHGRENGAGALLVARLKGADRGKNARMQPTRAIELTFSWASFLHPDPVHRWHSAIIKY